MNGYTPANTIVPPPDAGAVRTFATPALTVPTISSATSLSQTQVRVVFSEPISTATATAASNYALDLGGAVAAAALAADNLTVTLTTSPLTHNVLYTLTVNNIQDREDPPNTIAANSTIQFTVVPAVPPTIASVTAQDATHVVVVFSEQVTPSTATSTTNYAIDQGVGVTGASLAGDGKTVTLTTSTLTKNVTYTVTVNNVADLDSPPTPIASNTQATFVLPDVPLDMALWLKADAGVTVTGTAVSTWADQSGHARDATQTTAAYQPMFVASNSAINNKPVVRFDGTDDRMTFPLSVQGLSGMTIILVTACLRDQWNGPPGDYNTNAPAICWHSGSWFGVSVGPWQRKIPWRFGGGLMAPEYIRPTSIGASFSRTTTIKNGTTASLYVNGEWVMDKTGEPATITDASQPTGYLAYFFAGGGNCFNGDFAEVIVYTRALSNAERLAVDGYLNTKYFAPPSSPPSVAITAPASGLACGQGMAPVSLTASTTDGTPNTVTGVEFFDTVASVQTKLGDAAGGGGTWAFSWTTSAATLGTHSITAKATDGGGLTATAAPIIIKVWIPGDADGNALVEGLDYNAWQNGYQQPNSTFATGDYDGNGQVDGLDYNVWQNNYNHTAVYQADEFGPMAAAGTASTPTGAAPVAAESGPMAQPTAVMIAGGPAAASAPHLVAVTPAPGATVSGVAGLTLVFDSAVQVGAGAVEVSGLATGGHADYAQAYDAATRTLVLTWTQALPADVYSVRVVADFVVGVGGGAPLDGEVGDPAAPTLPSGDGVPGGDALLEFAVE